MPPPGLLPSAVAAGVAASSWGLLSGFALPGPPPRGQTRVDRTRVATRAVAAGGAAERLSWRATASVPLSCGAGFAAAAITRRLQGKQAKRRAQQQRRLQAIARAAEPEVDPRPPQKDPQVPPVRMPMISTGTGNIDVMSRLLQDRVLILSGQVNDEMANVLIAQLLYLANQDKEKDITIYINSPGGSVSAGLAIYDSMQFVPCDVKTVCFGMAASMGAFLLGAGTKGKRKSLPNSRVMIHQPLGGAGGQAADIEIQAKEILFLRELLNTYMADFTGKSLETIAVDTDRDYFMTAEEAVEYGLIDEVIETASWPRLQKPPKPDL
mmetsp:Transcript_105418/g.328613  ORF Transcript_105418/g.328613 Transcript_105418/m.328613 type:complete len:324 (+) Transcript_105418:47-1018(+)